MNENESHGWNHVQIEMNHMIKPVKINEWLLRGKNESCGKNRVKIKEWGTMIRENKLIVCEKSHENELCGWEKYVWTKNQGTKKNGVKIKWITCENKGIVGKWFM